VSLSSRESPAATVLVVDDIAANRNVLGETLKEVKCCCP
jgi:CheY-like chemotaxis protein